jgi:hypothetical protein
MAGVERLMVVDHPLASNPEDQNGPGILQQTSDFLRGYNVTPQSAYVGAGVGVVLEPGIKGALKGFLIASLISYVTNTLSSS